MSLPIGMRYIPPRAAILSRCRDMVYPERGREKHVANTRTAVQNGTVTIRERDTTSQYIGKIDDVLSTVDELVKGNVDWAGAAGKLEVYSGVQDVAE